MRETIKNIKNEYKIEKSKYLWYNLFISKWMFGCEVSNRDMSNDYPEIVG